MITLLPPDVSCRVFTFKEGALSNVAHDLELDVQGLSLSLAEDRSHVELSFDPTSLRVHQPTFSDKDKHKIETAITDVILQTRDYPRIHFTSTEVHARGPGYSLSGVLDLHGVKRSLSCDVQLIGEVLTAELAIQQTDFGIRPYSVMFGALRVRNDIRVVVRLNAKALRDVSK